MSERTRSTRALTGLGFALILGALASDLTAQTPGASSGAAILGSEALDAAVAGHESAAQRERAGLARLLERGDVQDLARAHGIDIEQARANAAVLSDEDVREVAPLLERAAAALQSSTITISAVSLIIILLLILILVD